jgi:membrane fusion protein, adhesin transport system
MTNGVSTTASDAVPQRKSWRQDEISLTGADLRVGHHLLLGAVAALFIIGGVWAAWANLDEVTRGEGRVITASQVQLIQNLEGGIVSEILIREGDTVDKGQVLFRLQEVRFDSALREGQQTNHALQARIARLQAETRRTALAMPASVTKAAPALAENETRLFEARRRDLQAKRDVLAQQLVQREQELKELQSRRDRLNEQLGLVRKEIGITAPLVKQGVVSEIELLRLEREATRLRTDADGAELAIPRVRSAIEEARRRMEDSETTFLAEASGELAQARAELSKLTETLPALQDRVSRTTVRSPVKGTVKQVLVKTTGGVVQPGSSLAEIVPSEDTLLVEARVRPSDIAFVTPGQKAVVKIATYDYSIYGGIEGTIEHVSADSVQPQQGEPYYIAHVRTGRNALERGGKALPVFPGMTATVDILTGKKTVLDYLLKPINKARESALRER